MLRKVIATGVTGLGISAVAMVPSAMPEENTLLLLQQQIGRLTEAIQREMAADEERFRRIEEDIRQLKRRLDNTTTVQPTTIQPTTASSVQPSSVQPNSVQPNSVRPATVQPATVQPSSVRSPRHRHYYPRYVWRPPRWEPWW
jgi:transcription elongation GreA/GreB family factor